MKSLDETIPDYVDIWRKEVMNEVMSFTSDIRALEAAMSDDERAAYEINNLAFRIK
jgi:hypothetical protein